MELHDDDMPVGRILSRREMLALMGGSALVAGVSLSPLMKLSGLTSARAQEELPACIVRPELTEGPYFVDDQLERIDIRIDPTDDSIKPGLSLLLIYRVSDVTGGACAPLAGAQVDVWHCDADGVYSGVDDPGFDTTGALWLRGYQVTDEDGIAKFLTIVPGWYSGRAVHIHFKIRTEAGYEFTSQFFFDPDLIAEIYAEEPYAAKGLPNVPNESDGIYQQSGDMLTLELLPLTDEQLADLAGLEVEGVTEGYSATFDVGLDLSDAEAGASDGFGGGGNGGGGRGPGGPPPGGG